MSMSIPTPINVLKVAPDQAVSGTRVNTVSRTAEHDLVADTALNLAVNHLKSAALGLSEDENKGRNVIAEKEYKKSAVLFTEVPYMFQRMKFQDVMNHKDLAHLTSIAENAHKYAFATDALPYSAATGSPQTIACDPNCVLRSTPSNFVRKDFIQAIKDIQAGEEITISYINCSSETPEPLSYRDEEQLAFLQYQFFNKKKLCKDCRTKHTERIKRQMALQKWCPGGCYCGKCKKEEKEPCNHLLP